MKGEKREERRERERQRQRQAEKDRQRDGDRDRERKHGSCRSGCYSYLLLVIHTTERDVGRSTYMVWPDSDPHS